MALKFLKKLGEALFGKSNAKPSTKTPEAGGDKGRQNQKRHGAAKDGPQRGRQEDQRRERRNGAQQQQGGGRRGQQPQQQRKPRDPRQDAIHDAAIAAEAAQKAARTPARTVTASASSSQSRDQARGGRRRGEGRDGRHGARRPSRPDLPPTADELKAKEALPVADPNWTIDKFQVEPAEGKKRFHDFDLPPEIMHAIADLGFKYCTPIQAESLALALEGRNVAGRAQTGTGKTAAFLVAILTRYLRSPEARPEKNGAPRALVIAPTRELVVQIRRDAEALGRYCGLRCAAVFGGMDYNAQLRELQAGPVDLLVATPGRLIDYQRQRAVDLSHVDTLVIDEADRMLDMGFIPDVRKIIHCLPPRDKRRTMLYSATLNDDVMNLASQWMPDPVKVEIDADPAAAETIEQHVYITTTQEKFILLCNLLKRFEGQRVLIFCNRRVTTDRLAEDIERQGFPCEVLSGDVDQRRRLRVIEAFRSGAVKIVVATDVAGRGLHIADIGLVVNFELPYEAEDYVHRIGRTGRAGHVGTAVSFADPDESFVIPDIEEFIGEELKCDMPEEELLAPLPPPPRRHRRPRASQEQTATQEQPASQEQTSAQERTSAQEPQAAQEQQPQEPAPQKASESGDSDASPEKAAATPAAETTAPAPAAAPAAPAPSAPVTPAPAAQAPAEPAQAKETPAQTPEAPAQNAQRQQRRRSGHSALPLSAIDRHAPRPVIPGPQPAPQEWIPGQG